MDAPPALSLCLVALAGGVPWAGVLMARLDGSEIEQQIEQRWQAYLQQILDACSVMVYVRDAQGRFLFLNESFAADRGKTREEMVGTSFLVGRDSLEEDARVLAGETISKEEWRVHPITDREVCRLQTKRAGRSVHGLPVVIGTAYDITDLRQAQRGIQEALERERERADRIHGYIQRLIDVIPQPMYVKDEQSCYLLVNDAFVRERGVPRESIIGDSSIHPRSMPHVTARADDELAREVGAEDAAVLNGLEVLREESRLHRETGETFFRIISKRSCLDAEGNKVIVGANLNISSWRQAEQRAEAASRAKSLFLAAISHEIRTPLNGVIGMLRKVLRANDVPAAHRGSLEIGVQSAESLLALINDILDFSKIEAGKLTLESIDFDLGALLRGATRPFVEAARDAGLGFELEIDRALPAWVKGDPTRLRQVLVNLMGNALKFTSQGSVCVRVGLAAFSKGIYRVRFDVQDTGIGIGKDAQERLFQMFQQADDSTARKYGGTGLGLAICRQLVEAMGGELTLHSVVGEGSCFSFEMVCEAGVPARPEPPASSGPARALRILCVDDEPVNQLIIGDLLIEQGHVVVTADDGVQALQVLAREDFDLVLMDGHMPRMDGREATRLIRAGGQPGEPVRNPQVMIAAFTANVSAEDRRACIACGMNDFLVKPIDERELARVLRAAAQTPAAS